MIIKKMADAVTSSYTLYLCFAVATLIAIAGLYFI